MYSSKTTADQKYVHPPPQAPPPPSGNQQLPNQPLPPNTNGAWSSGLCDCFDDIPSCCLTYWCPCITFGQIAEIVDKGSTSCCASGFVYTLIACLIGCPCIYSCSYRSKIRQQHMLHETPCNDCLVHCFCEPCALCQDYRELKNRGFDMCLGWNGNVEKQNRQIAMAPAVEVGMTRSS